MIYLFLLFLSFALTWFIKNHAIKKNLLAEVNERSSHSVPTPHGGGVAIAVTWFFGLTLFFVQRAIDPALYYALMVGVIISVVSYLDDLYELSPRVRLITQALVAVLALYFLGGLKELDLLFFTIENPFITDLFAFLMIVWFINLYNFLDGIDGYAGSEAVFLGLAGFILFGGEHFLVLIASVMGFLVWNWHKAKIFMGDVGSTLLGYTVSVFTIYYANQEPTNFWTWIVLFGIFWFDATLTLLRRHRNKEKLSHAHKKHAYQRLNQSGWTHDKVVLASIGVNLILFGLVYFISDKMIAFLMSVLLLYIVTKIVDLKKGFRI